jgi:hypothetical protein
MNTSIWTSLRAKNKSPIAQNMSRDHAIMGVSLSALSSIAS